MLLLGEQHMEPSGVQVRGGGKTAAKGFSLDHVLEDKAALAVARDESGLVDLRAATMQQFYLVVRVRAGRDGGADAPVVPPPRTVEEKIGDDLR